MAQLLADLLGTGDALVASRRRVVPRNIESSPGEGCPFCPGQVEDRVVQALPEAGPWRSCSVANKFPYVDDAGPVRGEHEVLVLSPDHEHHFDTLPAREAGAALSLFAARYRYLSTRWTYVAAWANRGTLAGASQAHPHGQLMALDFLPPLIAGEVARMEQGCPLCAIPEELVVAEYDGFVLSVASRPRTNFELVIAPREHDSDFGALSPGAAEHLAGALGRGLGCALRLSGADAFNLAIHAAPGRTVGYHWHLHIVPRPGYLGGFEYATGLVTVAVSPSDAAFEMRSLLRTPGARRS